ncbi:Telomerase activating protein Est1 [Trinorchestia longiramus]|nr:Telomerase activating protein Est1 [Trinorchestia longiramus]
MENTSKGSTNQQKKRPQRRADIEIYRPGALRHRHQTFSDVPSAKASVEENGKVKNMPSSSSSNSLDEAKIINSSSCASSNNKYGSNNNNESYASTKKSCQRNNGFSAVTARQAKGIDQFQKTDHTIQHSEKTSKSSQLHDKLDNSKGIKNKDGKKEEKVDRTSSRGQTRHPKSNSNGNWQRSKPKVNDKLFHLNYKLDSSSNVAVVSESIFEGEDCTAKERSKTFNSSNSKALVVDSDLKLNSRLPDNCKSKSSCTPLLVVNADVKSSTTNLLVTVKNLEGNSKIYNASSSSSSEVPEVINGSSTSKAFKSSSTVASSRQLSKNDTHKKNPMKNNKSCTSKQNIIERDCLLEDNTVGRGRLKNFAGRPPPNDNHLKLSENASKNEKCHEANKVNYEVSVPNNILKEKNETIAMIAKQPSDVSDQLSKMGKNAVAISSESQRPQQKNHDKAKSSKSSEEINVEYETKEDNHLDWAEESYLESEKEKLKVQPHASSAKTILPYEQNLAMFLSHRQQELLSRTQALASDAGFDSRTGTQNITPSPSLRPPSSAEHHSLTYSNPVLVSNSEQLSNDFDLIEEPVTISGYEELLHNIHKGECDIQYYINSNQIPREFPRIMDIRVYLQSCYMKLFSGNIALCHQKNIEAQMWKALYYNIIEKLREYAAHVPELQQKSISTLLMLVQDGHNFLQSVVRALESRYGVSVARAACQGDGETCRGRAKMALGVAQRLLLDLGDLARYRLQYCGPGHAGANSALPYRWYQLASRLYPRNGRPFHQLAILSVTQKRPLDVFYFYVRSLMAANPFVSAKDSLTSFFEGIRTRFTVLKEELDCRSPSPRAPDQVVRQGALHREVWYRLDGSNATKLRTCALPTAQPALHDPVTKLVNTLPSDQLMKQFLTCFLHCHGLLFSRVSLEEFDACCRRCLLLFAALLQCTPSRLSGTHLLQVLALNMFAVWSTQLHGQWLCHMCSVHTHIFVHETPLMKTKTAFVSWLNLADDEEIRTVVVCVLMLLAVG